MLVETAADVLDNLPPAARASCAQPVGLRPSPAQPPSTTLPTHGAGTRMRRREMLAAAVAGTDDWLTICCGAAS